MSQKSKNLIVLVVNNGSINVFLSINKKQICLKTFASKYRFKWTGCEIAVAYIRKWCEIKHQNTEYNYYIFSFWK